MTQIQSSALVALPNVDRLAEIVGEVAYDHAPSEGGWSWNNKIAFATALHARLAVLPPEGETGPAVANDWRETARNDYVSDAQARDLFGTEDDEELPAGRVRVCEGEWVRIPGGYYFDKSAGLLHPETDLAMVEDKANLRVNAAYASMREDNDARRRAEASLKTCREEIADLREILATSSTYDRDERKSERARIVAYLRSFAKRVEPRSASANNFNAAADAIESGHAFPGGNPDSVTNGSERDQPYRLAIRKRNRAHVYEIMHETETHVELRWKTRIALPRETFEQDYDVTEPDGPISGT